MALGTPVGPVAYDRSRLHGMDTNGRGRIADQASARERALEKQAVPAALPGRVEDEVPEAVGDEAAVVALDRLRGVGVMAEDDVGAGIDDAPRDTDL